MAQASSIWQQYIDQILNWMLPQFKSGATNKQALERFRGPGGVLGFLTIVLAMLLWNWQLLLSSSVGVGVMIFAYAMQGWNWQWHWFEIRKFLNTPSRRLVLAVTSGGIACLSTYMAVAIWFSANSPWIAAGLILQGLGTLFTLILLVWQIINFYGVQEQSQLDKLLANLTEKNSLKRLIAVRQLTKLVTRRRVNTSEQQYIVECLQLLLCQEEEASIKEAVFESLQELDKLQMLAPKPKAIKIPTVIKNKTRVN